MDIDTFSALVESLKAEHAIWFEGESDRLATNSDLDALEAEIGVRLPNQYKDFARLYGGGYFAFTNVFSADRDGEWFILDQMISASFPAGFIPISDDEAGGYYGFVCKSGACEEGVYYFYSSEDDGPTFMFPSLFDYLVKVGLRQ